MSLEAKLQDLESQLGQIFDSADWSLEAQVEHRGVVPATEPSGLVHGINMDLITMGGSRMRDPAPPKPPSPPSKPRSAK